MNNVKKIGEIFTKDSFPPIFSKKILVANEKAFYSKMYMINQM